MAKKSRKQLIKEAVEAHADLNIFAAVVAILEGGTVSADAQPDDFRIIRMCERAQQKCLRRYDRALEALGEPYGGAAPLSLEQRAPIAELEPHAYVPSAMHMGDCAVCGHLQGSAIHSPFRRATEQEAGTE